MKIVDWYRGMFMYKTRLNILIGFVAIMSLIGAYTFGRIQQYAIDALLIKAFENHREVLVEKIAKDIELTLSKYKKGKINEDKISETE